MGCAVEVTETKESQQPGSGAAPRPWRDLGLRGASAAVLIPIAVFGIWSGGLVWDVLVGVAVVLLSWEWARFCQISIWRWPGMLMPAVSLGVMLLAAFGPPLGALGLLAAGTVILFLLRRHGDIWPAAGLFYIGLTGFSLVLLRGEDFAGLLNTLFMVLIVWASDTGAYIAGRALGGPKLAPAISPGKTWSGAAGGLVAATLIGAGAAGVAAARELRRMGKTCVVLEARARVGNLYINRSMIGAVVGSQPFGGEGLSGTGPKAGGPNYLHRFCAERVTSTDTTSSGGNASLLSLDDIGL